MKLLFRFIVLSLILTSCAQDEKEYVVTIKTEYGDMIGILYDETPQHKANFIKLAKEHYYDGTLFHRVMKGFMIQGGDPDSKTVKPGEALGNGGPDYTIPAEFNPNFFHEKGAIAAARLNDPVNPKKESSGSQFYIVQGQVLSEVEVDDLKIDQQKLGEALRIFVQNPIHRGLRDTLTQLQENNEIDAFQKKVFGLVPILEKETHIKIIRDVSDEKRKAYTTSGGAPFLDDQYTVFGKIIKGLEIIDKIAQLHTDNTDRPVEDFAMTVSVKEMSKKKIEEEYNYTFPKN
jgi:peptidyl-prolyl cis-trans isomerase B (cyclophilin B)